MEVEYSLTVDDLHAFRRYHNRRGKAKRQPAGVGAYLRLAVLVVLAVAVFSFGLPSWLTSDLVVGLIVGAAGAVLLLVLAAHLSIRKQIRRYFEGNPKVFARRRLTLLPEGVRFLSPFYEALVRWPGVLRVGVTDEHLFLYTGTEECYVVPRRAFAGPRDFDAYVAQAESYLEGHTTARFADAERPSSDRFHAPEERIDDRRSARH
jgi:hypothetical protein